MRTEQCVSVTELSKNTSRIIHRAPQVGAQYIFVNNKPQAVILSMQQYEKFEKDEKVEFGTTLFETLSPEAQDMYAGAKKQSKDTFVDY